MRISSGIYPTAIDREIIPEDYINVIAVRTDDLDAQYVKDIKEVVESEAFANIMSDPAKIFKDFQKTCVVKKAKTKVEYEVRYVCCIPYG